MRRTDPWRATALTIAAAALIPVGAAKKKDVPDPKIEETVGTVANIIGNTIKVEGVGLVVGLDDTGSEPSASWYTKKLTDEMLKAGVEHPDRLIQSKKSSVVIVRATIPAGVSTTDRFDVDIELPPASATTSLAGGWLINTQLAPMGQTKEGPKEGNALASVYGPVMTGKAGAMDNARVGQVLGGARVKADAPYGLSIKEARRSGKTSKLLEAVIKQRFTQTDASDNKGMTIAKTDGFLVLKVPKVYHHNQTRYHQIIKLLPLVDNPSLREARLAAWGKELLDPKTSGVAALRLEGIGPNALPMLKAGLDSPDWQVRFFSAEALAYLNNSDGVKVLVDTAKNHPEFRSFALKSMAAMDQSAALMGLRSLMGESDFELRYGAFDALRTLDPYDPFLGARRLYDDPPVDEDDADNMALQIAGRSARKKKTRAEEPFSLYVVDCEGPPMVHVSRNLRCEIVIFGRDQKLLTPVVLGSGGSILLNASDGDDQVQLTKITSKSLDDPESKINCPLDLPEVIRQMAALQSSYPEIVSILMSASTQKNLAGPMVVDAVPLANKAYDEAQLLGVTKKDDQVEKASAEPEKKPSFLEKVRKRFGR
ncbi:flagellar basal body P-ring protein FlgI [Tundrisphaera sp. TA3]|uniref:flagellar basal body P-ring protein FlgI n=1 Tax=Tundrisphaera sp. TA3 TaxID=3435775 RepID=UPI003EB89DB2